ncbi:MAG: glycosyltransferase [Candidatus Acidiferrales bacterium]
MFSNLPGVEIDGWPGNLLRKYAVWHMHWPDSLLNIPNTPKAIYKVNGMLATMDFLRLRGTKAIWTMHNFASHEARHPALERSFWRRFIPRVDGAIALSSMGLKKAFERFPQLRDIPTTVIPHGHYREQYPLVDVDSRKILGIPNDVKVMMFFGAVRAYKNVDVLVRAFRKVKRQDALLYVVGDPNSKELSIKIAEAASGDHRISLKFEFVDPKNVSIYLRAADLVVLPYRHVLNSGSALLALSCSRPVLVPDLGAMGELRIDFSDTWVRTYEGHLTEYILEDGLDWSTRPRPAICPMPERYEWKSIGLETVEFYKKVVSGSLQRSESTRYVATGDGSR